MTKPEENNIIDQNLALAAAVHGNIASSNQIIAIFEKSLMDTNEEGELIEVFSTPRAIIETLTEVLKTNVKMVTDMFEENTEFHEQAETWRKLREKGRANGGE